MIVTGRFQLAGAAGPYAYHDQARYALATLVLCACDARTGTHRIRLLALAEQVAASRGVTL